jgi:hypothetical protein
MLSSQPGYMRTWLALPPVAAAPDGPPWAGTDFANAVPYLFGWKGCFQRAEGIVAAGGALFM